MCQTCLMLLLHAMFTSCCCFLLFVLGCMQEEVSSEYKALEGQQREAQNVSGATAGVAVHSVHQCYA